MQRQIEKFKNALREGERLDDLQHAGRMLIQNTKEFAFSLDAVLLAHFATLKKEDRLLDLGTGTGILPILLAEKYKKALAIELNPITAELAERNVRLNGLTEKISVLKKDYRNIEELTARARFDVVLANPPYRPKGTGKESPSKGIAMARHELTATLEDVIRVASYALRAGGRFAMVHLPERMAEIFKLFDQHALAPKRMRLVQPSVGKAPNLLLVEAVKGGKVAGLKILPPFLVYRADGSYGEELLSYYQEEKN